MKKGTLETMPLGLMPVAALTLAGCWTPPAGKVGSQVANFNRIKVGGQIQASLNEELAVYLLQNDRRPDGATAETPGVNGRMLNVGLSYRLLILQYPNGQSEIFKPGLNTKMEQMIPGDSVVARPKEATAIRIKKTAAGQARAKIMTT